MILNYFHELNKLDETWELEEVFETHNELNQQLFDNDILRKDVRKRLLEIVDLFVSKIKEDNIPIDVIDYWLLGSNAAYNYGPKSDIDIHIIVNLEDLGVDPYILQLLYNYVKSDFNNKYDIMVKGHEVELYLEDVRSGAVTNGIYSLKQNRWIKFPTRTEYMRFDVTETDEYKEWYQRYLELKENEIEQFINDLYLMRKESLSVDGEWGTGNLVFKEFRNLGYLDSLKDRKYEYKSRELTLEGLNEAWYKVYFDEDENKGDFIYIDAQNIQGVTDKYYNGHDNQVNQKILLKHLSDNIQQFEKRPIKKIVKLSKEEGAIARKDTSKVFTTKSSHFRKDSHTIAMNALKNLDQTIWNNCIVHHRDRSQANDSLDNLVVIPLDSKDKNSKNQAQILHHTIHQFDMIDPNYDAKAPILVFNDQGKLVTKNVTIHIDK